MPQDHPAPVSGERGTHRRINGCRRPPDFRFTLCCPCVPSGTRCPSPRILLRSRDSPPPPGGRLFLRCRRPGSGFVDETNVLCRRGLPPVPHCARTLPKTPLLCHFPKNARFRQYGFFRTPAKPGVSEGGFWRFGFQTPLFRPATAADCNFATLMPHFVPPARQGGLTAFRRGVLPFLMAKCCQSDAFLRHFSRFQTIFTKSLQKSSGL